MKIFNKNIQIKKVGCNVLNIPGRPIYPSVNLFVKVTKGCNAHCLFCSNAGAIPSSSDFNLDKLFDVINELQINGIFINRLNITGGEPSTVSTLVDEILERMQTNIYRKIHLHLNTNGLLPTSQKMMANPRWNSISMSLHHYKREKLEELYDTSISADAFKFKDINLQKVNISCNLIKGYIDNASDANEMLDFSLNLGIPRIGFVALMKVNDYCKSHFVDLEDIHIAEIPHVYFTKSMNRGADCKCSNYLYNKDLK